MAYKIKQRSGKKYSSFLNLDSVEGLYKVKETGESAPYVYTTGIYCTKNGEYCTITSHTRFNQTTIRFVHGGRYYERIWEYLLTQRSIIACANFLIKDVLNGRF